MNSPTRVHEVMTTDPLTVTSGTMVLEAVNLMLEREVTGLPVVDDGTLVGILTEQDCLRVAFHSHYYQSPPRTVADAMTRGPETLDADADIITAVELFLARPFRQFPVLRDGALVGLVSRREALRVVKKQV